MEHIFLDTPFPDSPECLICSPMWRPKRGSENTTKKFASHAFRNYGVAMLERSVRQAALNPNRGVADYRDEFLRYMQGLGGTGTSPNFR